MYGNSFDNLLESLLRFLRIFSLEFLKMLPKNYGKFFIEFLEISWQKFWRFCETLPKICRDFIFRMPESLFPEFMENFCPQNSRWIFVRILGEVFLKSVENSGKLPLVILLKIPRKLGSIFQEIPPINAYINNHEIHREFCSEFQDVSQISWRILLWTCGEFYSDFLRILPQNFWRVVGISQNFSP